MDADRPAAPGHLLALLYQAQRASYFIQLLILGDSAIAWAWRASIHRASVGGNAYVHAEGLYRRMDEIPVLRRAYVTWMYVVTGQNMAETARRTGLDRRTILKWLDADRLARWLKARK